MFTVDPQLPFAECMIFKIRVWLHVYIIETFTQFSSANFTIGQLFGFLFHHYLACLPQMRTKRGVLVS
ncbi:MAG: hypothetical protein ABS34_08575 [Opitutaceae bacterium BACL24 MAG-120322-bin51]|nr:MAG: hypothetical protein ABS34_08575 [Opitutaceae bacterium BACL24 MAG-120322-bin51]